MINQLLLSYYILFVLTKLIVLLTRKELLMFCRLANGENESNERII